MKTDDHEAYSNWLHKHMYKKGRNAGQIDSLMESGTGLLLFEVWEAAKDECKRELRAITKERDESKAHAEAWEEEHGEAMKLLGKSELLIGKVLKQRDRLAEAIITHRAKAFPLNGEDYDLELWETITAVKGGSHE